MNTLARWVVGIDIGGTKTSLGAVTPDGRIVARATLPTEAALGFARAVDRFEAALRALAAEHDLPLDQLEGIGIGCAGPVNPRRGTIHNPYTLEGWDDCDIVTPLRERFAVPVRLENDADAAALGECAAGAGRGFDPVAMLTFGTGVGGALVSQGAVYRGANGEHAELGHMVVRPDGPPCYCGARGCLESLASGTAIGEAGRASGLADAHAVFAAARAGHPAARTVVNRAVDAAATAAWTLCHTLLPQRLVLGGGIMDTEFELFAHAMRERIAPATQFSRGAGEVARAALGNDAGLVGAASMMFA